MDMTPSPIVTLARLPQLTNAPIPDGCGRRRRSSRAQAAAIGERPIPDGCDAVGDGDARKILAIPERSIPDGSDAAVVRDDAVFTAGDQSFAFRFDQAISRTVIDGIFRRNCDARQAAAAGKRFRLDRRDGARDRDRPQFSQPAKALFPIRVSAAGSSIPSKPRAAGKRITLQYRYAVREGDVRQAAAIRGRYRSRSP